MITQLGNMAAVFVIAVTVTILTAYVIADLLVYSNAVVIAFDVYTTAQ